MRLAAVNGIGPPPVIHLLTSPLNGRRPLGVVINQLYLDEALRKKYDQKCESLEEMRFLTIAKKLSSVTIWSNGLPGLILQITDGGIQRAVPGLTLRPKTGRAWAVTYDHRQLQGRVTDQGGRFRVQFGQQVEDGWFEIPVENHGLHIDEPVYRPKGRKVEALSLHELRAFMDGFS